MKKQILGFMMILILVTAFGCARDKAEEAVPEENISDGAAEESENEEAESEEPEASAEEEVYRCIDDRLMELFEIYSGTEDQEAADEIMKAFKEDTENFLYAFTAQDYKEQVLMLLGSRIQEANAGGDTSYQEALDQAAELELNEEMEETLQVIIRNVETAGGV